MLQTILNLLPIASILISLYVLQLLKKERDANKSIEDNMILIDKRIEQDEKNIIKVDNKLHDMDENISDWKLKVSSNIKDVENKVTDLYNRWDIVSDNRITSIPQNNKEWWEAKQIVAQAPVKVWKPKNLGQSKSGFVNENAKYNNIEQDEDEVNQDFSDLSDEDFESILDDESDNTSSSGSSGATDKLQQQKPKRKKAPQQTM